MYQGLSKENISKNIWNEVKANVSAKEKDMAIFKE